jgi:hypothetical protein
MKKYLLSIDYEKLEKDLAKDVEKGDRFISEIDANSYNPSGELTYWVTKSNLQERLDMFKQLKCEYIKSYTEKEAIG